jgi:hypothetical protein
MDEPNHTDVDLPEVDGIPIPPYQPLSYGAPGPVTDEGMKWGLIIVVALAVACPTLLFIALLLKGS